MSTARTRLYQRRTAAGLSQCRLAGLTGISLRTLQRIERAEVDNPPIRYLGRTGGGRSTRPKPRGQPPPAD